MNEQERRGLIQDYLGRLADELGDAPGAARRELVEDVRGHIEEAWAVSPDKGRAALLNILDRLGTPEAVAREMRERLGAGLSPTREGPGLLEIAALALTALFWPIGVLLAWVSPRWRTRDKVIATLIPALGFALVVGMSMVASAAYTLAPAVTSVAVQVTAETTNDGRSTVAPDQPPAVADRDTAADSSARVVQAILARFLVFYGLLGAPFTSALYLALRLRSRDRRAAATLVASVAILVAVAVIALALTAPVAGSATGAASESATAVLTS